MKTISSSLLGTLLIFFLTISCEKNTPEPSDPNGNDSISNIISHYFALNNPIWVRDDDTVRLKTYRLRDTVKIFLDSTVNTSDKAVLEEMIELVEQNIEGSGVKFVFVEDTSDFSLGIVHGSKKYLFERFNLSDFTEAPDFALGQYCKTERFCTTIQKGFIWYESNSDQLLRHEFGHALGLRHAIGHYSLMHTDITHPFSSGKLSKLDLSVLRLKYYDGVLGTLSPEYVDSCSDENIIMRPSEENDFKVFLEEIIRNNYH